MIMRNFSVVWAISGFSKDQVIKYGSTKQRNNPKLGLGSKIGLQNAKWPKLDSTPQSCANDIISDRLGFTRRCDTTLMAILVIAYRDLRFICDLVLEFWDFIVC